MNEVLEKGGRIRKHRNDERERSQVFHLPSIQQKETNSRYQFDMMEIKMDDDDKHQIQLPDEDFEEEEAIQIER